MQITTPPIKALLFDLKSGLSTVWIKWFESITQIVSSNTTIINNTVIQAEDLEAKAIFFTSQSQSTYDNTEELIEKSINTAKDTSTYQSSKNEDILTLYWMGI